MKPKPAPLCASEASSVVRLWTWRLPVVAFTSEKPVPESLRPGVVKSSVNGVKLSRM